jgi:hypothetical protein
VLLDSSQRIRKEMKQLPDIEYTLTEYERSQAALATVHLEALRRDRNRRDERRANLKDTETGGLIDEQHTNADASRDTE